MQFTNKDSQTLLNIMRLRRDVRGNRFLNTPIEEEKLQLILEAALYAPSVGYSQPWKFVVIKNQKIKQKVVQNFTTQNQKAKNIFKDSPLYSQLKLEGIKEAPINIAVLYQHPQKEVLGMTSMDKMGEYSVVCAVQNMWLMARSLNIGIGWVSILDEKQLLRDINANQNSKLIAYLCVGYVKEFLEEPELKTLSWEQQKQLQECVVTIDEV